MMMRSVSVAVGRLPGREGAAGAALGAGAAATTGGWAAPAVYACTAKTCALYYGNIAALAPAVVAGEPKCT